MRMASSAVSITVGSINSARAIPPATAENPPVTQHHRAISEYARQNRGKAAEHLGPEAHDLGQPGLRADFRQEDGGHDSHGHADQRGDAHHDQRAENGVAEAAALAPRPPAAAT